MKSVMGVGLCPLLNYVWGAIDRINGQEKEREREKEWQVKKQNRFKERLLKENNKHKSMNFQRQHHLCKDFSENKRDCRPQK